jgi:hypothetical protein
MTEQPPENPADHAQDFSHRYADDLEILSGQVMIDLGLPAERMGARDPERNREHHTFFPGDREGGTVSLAGQVTLDSGLMNPDLLANGFNDATQKLWQRTRVRDRAQAIIIHELAEYEHCDHELALIAAPDTTLPITQEARELLRQMERGWHWR